MRWSSLRRLSANWLAKASTALPVLGSLILFSPALSAWLEVKFQGSSLHCAHGEAEVPIVVGSMDGCLASQGVVLVRRGVTGAERVHGSCFRRFIETVDSYRLKLNYLGIVLLGLSSFIFILLQPRLFQRFPDIEDYISFHSTANVKQIEEMVEELRRLDISDEDIAAARHKAKGLVFADYFYDQVDMRKDPLSRTAIGTLSVAGYALIATSLLIFSVKVLS